MSVFVNNYNFSQPVNPAELQRLVRELAFILNGNIGNDNLLSTARSANQFFFWEIPSPSPDGTTTVFYVTPYVAGTLHVICSNSLQTSGTDFVEGNNFFTMTVAPSSDIIMRCWGIQQT